jgi:hypothetical protein
MKKLILVITVLFFSHFCFAQKYLTYGFKIGISTSHISGDPAKGYNKGGFMGGIVLNKRFQHAIHGQIELYYAQNFTKGNFIYYLSKRNSVDAPLLVQYILPIAKLESTPASIYLEIGPDIRYLLETKEYSYSGTNQGITPFNKTELGINYGIGILYNEAFIFSFRYTNSISSVKLFGSGDNSFYSRKFRNNILVFSISYSWGRNRRRGFE